METYENTAPIWDYSQPTSFSQLPDDDFLALLQKQFPASTDPNPALFTNGIDPQNLTHLPLPALTPPSEDSSPSPPNVTAEPHPRSAENDDPALKRKASYDSFDDEGPSQKSQHTASNSKKGSARRKSGDPGGADQSRLLKRKEQNRAAQRAFRERKEKHVKDLEDKVAALEAKNEEAVSENDNLRDLLSRLQGENLRLKQGSFSFSIPKNAGSSSQGHPTPPGNFSTPSPDMNDSSPHLFDAASNDSSITSSPPSHSTNSQNSLFPNDPFDWNSLTSFDPAVLNLLDDSSQPTATDASMQMDFGFGGSLSPKMPYTTIASNPLFMSFADSFDSSPITIADDPNSFNFDTYQPWPISTLSAPKESGSLDEVFNGGSYLARQGPVEFDVLLKSPPPSISPVSHTTGLSNATSSSSFSSNPNLYSMQRQSPASMPEDYHNHKECPKTKAEVKMAIAAEGASPFAPAGTLQKSADEQTGTMISCQGANLPKTIESDDNIEVLAAWRNITSNPMFKDVDINELCSEFTSKAKCDGRKVVLEPQSVHLILETLTKQR